MFWKDLGISDWIAYERFNSYDDISVVVVVFVCFCFCMFLNSFVLEDDRRFKGCFWKDSSCNMILDLLD